MRREQLAVCLVWPARHKPALPLRQRPEVTPTKARAVAPRQERDGPADHEEPLMADEQPTTSDKCEHDQEPANCPKCNPIFQDEA